MCENDLSSSIPNAVTSLTILAQLFISENSISGAVPNAVGSWWNLQLLYLSVNQLSGCIPDSIGGMEQLAILGLDVNQLSGTIPDMICNLKRMMAMQLFSNYLAGPIPTCLSELFRSRAEKSHKHKETYRTPPNSDPTLRFFMWGPPLLENKAEGATHIKNLGLHCGPLHSLCGYFFMCFFRFLSGVKLCS